MQRRDFIKGLSALGAISSTGAVAAFADNNRSRHTAVLGEDYKKRFAQQLSDNPQLLGFANVRQNFAETKLQVEGAIPKALNGILLRNGPAKHERGGIRYQHLFEGDGMLQKFTLNNGVVTHRGRFIETPKFTAEQAADRFLYSGPDTQIAHSLAVPNSDTVNTANTSVMAVGEDVWALWEAGSATRISLDELSFAGQVNLGENNHYGSTLKGLPFSAHPKVEANGEIWNFGLNPNGHIVLYHLAENGIPKRIKLIKTGYKGGMLHDFLITDKHVLLILPSLTRNRSDNASGFFAKTAFDANLPMRVIKISKSDLSVKKEYQLPSGWVFHFGNAWEDNSGTIRFDGSLYPDIEVLHKLGGLMKGDVGYSAERSKLALFTLFVDGKAKREVLDLNSEFPKVSNHLVGLKNRYLLHLSSPTRALWSDSVCLFDHLTGNNHSYHYGDDYLVEEHLLINLSNQEGKGYVIGTALHVPSRRTCLSVFNIEALSDGPVGRAWLPYHLPLGFHGTFIAS